VRLDDAVTYFLAQWPAEGPPADTVRTYSGHLNWLVAFAAARRKSYLRDLTPEFLRSAMTARMTRPRDAPAWKDGKAAAHGLAYAARRMAAWLASKGVEGAHDLSTVKAPRPPERVQPRLRAHEFQCLEDAILRRLVAPQRRGGRAMIARDLALIYLLADTGLRAFEVCGMTIGSVDFPSGSVTVYGKGQKERSLSIVDASDPHANTTLRLLRDWITARATLRGTSSHDYLWVSVKGNPLNRDQLRLVLNGICRQAGLDENRPPHTFRRGHFTETYRASPESLSVLAARMGWSKKSHHMVDVYTRGAEVDLARETALPAVSSRWRLHPVASGLTSPNVGTMDEARTARANSRKTSRRNLS
jgi:site-specific recombinase XerD